MRRRSANHGMSTFSAPKFISPAEAWILEEIEFKFRIGKNLEAVREAVLTRFLQLGDQLKKTLATLGVHS